MVGFSSVLSSTLAYANQTKSADVAIPADSGPSRATADVVEFSASALAASGGEKLSARNPEMFINERQIMENLNRIFMEALFGKEEGEKESVEEELVRTVVEEPLANRVLDDLAQG